MTEVAERPAHPLDSWPSRGYDGPQPWEHDELGIPADVRANIGTDRNTVTPVITHTLPILTSGSAHPCVHELGRKLGELGFVNSVSEGRNHFGTVDPTILTAVSTFRQQFGVRPDPSAFGGNTPQGRATAEAHLDPWTIEAILKAHKREFGD